MTLNDILTAALAQLDRGHDAQTLENYRVRLTQYANDAQRELADALGLFRTDKVRTSAGIVDTSLLPRRVKRIERVVQLGRAVPFRCGDRTNTLLLPYDTAAEITYRYEPRTLNDNSDRSDLDERAAAEKLFALGVRMVVVTRGANGSAAMFRHKAAATFILRCLKRARPSCAAIYATMILSAL